MNAVAILMIVWLCGFVIWEQIAQRLLFFLLYTFPMNLVNSLQSYVVFCYLASVRKKVAVKFCCFSESAYLCPRKREDGPSLCAVGRFFFSLFAVVL